MYVCICMYVCMYVLNIRKIKCRNTNTRTKQNSTNQMAGGEGAQKPTNTHTKKSAHTQLPKRAKNTTHKQNKMRQQQKNKKTKIFVIIK